MAEGRSKEFRRSCDKFAALRRTFLAIILCLFALFAAIFDAEKYLQGLKEVVTPKAPVDTAPCSPVIVYVEQLNIVERVC